MTHHTGRLKDLHEVATFTREHRLQGLRLRAVRHARRQGRLKSLLQTPTGSRQFLPLESTEADTMNPPRPSHSALALLAGSLRSDNIVDTLLEWLLDTEDAGCEETSDCTQTKRVTFAPVEPLPPEVRGARFGGHPQLYCVAGSHGRLAAEQAAATAGQRVCSSVLTCAGRRWCSRCKRCVVRDPASAGAQNAEPCGRGLPVDHGSKSGFSVPSNLLGESPATADLT